MHLIETCPICNSDLTDICYTIYPPIYGKQCFACGWRSDAEKEEVMRIPYKEKEETKMYDVLSEYCGISCSLCNKYFNKNGSCPSEIDMCGSKEHWKILLERINKNGQ